MIEKMDVTLKSKELKNMSEKKKKYETPVLLKMGAMQKVTLGGSQSPGDSGQTVELINT